MKLAGQFIDTGLPANNGHRQTRLSGDGRFLATTCDDTLTTCVAALDPGVDPYVQDLGTRSDTGFPNNALPTRSMPASTRRFRVRRGATAFRFALSEPAAMRIVLRRLGRYVGQLRGRGLAAGANSIPWGGLARPQGAPRSVRGRAVGTPPLTWSPGS